MTIVAFVAFALIVRNPEIAPITTPAAGSFDNEMIAEGAKLAAMGNCVECHTAPQGKPFAGGYALETPFGTIFGSNLTPDQITGIGSWSEAAFQRAMQKGIARDGTYLYPAFPYTHFTKVTDKDIKALYAYLMTRPAVKNDVPAPNLPFPFNIRLSLAGWNFLFFKPGPFAEDATRTAAWNRGAYIAEGLGHCSICHSPLNNMGAENTFSRYSGGEADGWTAPPLDGSAPRTIPWTKDQLKTYLRGDFSTEHGISAGPMRGVSEALRKLPDDDLDALGTYIASLDTHRSASDQAQLIATARSQEITAMMPKDVTLGLPDMDGEKVFAAVCSTCHFAGPGYPLNRPAPLALSSVVNAPDARNFMNIVLDGLHVAQGGPGSRSMPEFDHILTDGQIIALANYVQARFSAGAQWQDVSETLKQIRKTRHDAIH